LRLRRLGRRELVGPGRGRFELRSVVERRLGRREQRVRERRRRWRFGCQQRGHVEQLGRRCVFGKRRIQRIPERRGVERFDLGVVVERFRYARRR
jgi:hypothetical protein